MFRSNWEDNDCMCLPPRILCHHCESNNSLDALLHYDASLPLSVVLYWTMIMLYFPKYMHFMCIRIMRCSSIVALNARVQCYSNLLDCIGSHRIVQACSNNSFKHILLYTVYNLENKKWRISVICNESDQRDDHGNFRWIKPPVNENDFQRNLPLIAYCSNQWLEVLCYNQYCNCCKMVHACSAEDYFWLFDIHLLVIIFCSNFRCVAFG
jgi:hypothetical protein